RQGLCGAGRGAAGYDPLRRRAGRRPPLPRPDEVPHHRRLLHQRGGHRGTRLYRQHGPGRRLSGADAGSLRPSRSGPRHPQPQTLGPFMSDFPLSRRTFIGSAAALAAVPGTALGKMRKLKPSDTVNVAVIIATPDHHHAVAAKMAMERGIHVYVQKPLTYTIHEGRVLLDLARKNPKLVTQMGNQGHSGDDGRRAVELIRGGAIGTVRE